MIATPPRLRAFELCRGCLVGRLCPRFRDRNPRRPVNEPERQCRSRIMP